MNGLTQVTMIQLCCRATRTSGRRPAKDRGLLWSLCRPVVQPEEDSTSTLLKRANRAN